MLTTPVLANLSLLGCNKDGREKGVLRRRH